MPWSWPCITTTAAPQFPVYDPFGRLGKVVERGSSPAVLVAEYRYNGLNQRITAHFDTDADGDVDGGDVVSHFVYDSRWRPPACRWVV